MATEEKVTKDPTLEHQLAKVAELGKDPDNTMHTSEVPSAPLTEHGDKSGLKSLVDDLHGRREKIKLGGGPEKVAGQHGKGKLTARERIDLLVDRGTFVELGAHGRPHFSQRQMEGRDAPAEGVVTGWGDIVGRRCAVV